MRNAEETRRLEAIISRFPKKRILVLGDLMLDQYISGSASRLSPEAPVPVVTVNQESFTPVSERSRAAPASAASTAHASKAPFMEALPFGLWS